MDWIDKVALRTRSPLPQTAPDFWNHPLIFSIGLPETFTTPSTLADTKLKAFIFFFTFFDPPQDFRGLKHMLLPMRFILSETAKLYQFESKEFMLFLNEFIAEIDDYIIKCPDEEREILSANKLQGIQQLGVWRFHFHCSQVDRSRIRDVIKPPDSVDVVNVRSLAYLRDGTLDPLYKSMALQLHLALKKKLLLKLERYEDERRGENDTYFSKELIYDETLACEHCLHLTPIIFKFEESAETEGLEQRFKFELRKVSNSKKEKWLEGLPLDQDLRVRLDSHLRRVHSLLLPAFRLVKRTKKHKRREWNNKTRNSRGRLLPPGEFEETIEENEEFEGDVEVDFPFPVLSGGVDDSTTSGLVNRSYGRRPRRPMDKGEHAGDYEKNGSIYFLVSWLVDPYQNAMKQEVQLESMICNDNPPVWGNRCLLMQTASEMLKSLSREPNDIRLVILFMMHMGLSWKTISVLRVGVPDVISKMENPVELTDLEFDACLKNMQWGEIYIDIEVGDLLFFLPKDISSYYKERKASYFEGCITSSNVVRIPIPQIIMVNLKAWVVEHDLYPFENHLGDVVRNAPRKLFKYQKKLLDNYEQYCMRYGKSNYENISESRFISTFRALYVGQLKLPPLYANLISLSVPANYRVQHFYSNISYNHLRERYFHANNLLSQAFKQNKALNDIKNHKKDYRFGSKLVPETNQLNNYFSILRETIQDGLSRNEVMPSIWNALAVFCFRLLQLSTGIRPVRDGLTDWGDINFHVGWVRISDKDNRFFYEARIVPMASELKKWLVVLADYQRDIFLEANFHAKEILGPYRKQPTQDMFLYFNEGSKQIEPFNQTSIKIVEDELGLCFSFKENALRHNLLTNLLENDVDQNCIDFVMGHKHFGKEPFGSFSMINVKSYSRLAIEAIDNFVVAPVLQFQTKSI